MISVIIPVLNESETIGSVVSFVRAAPNVSEVIVLDDGSIDGSPELARDAGARVFTSTLLGKGASMEDGMFEATNETLLYLDGDLRGLADNLVHLMTEPILQGQADFVKAKFSRSAGRVTTLTAKPLLRTFFPELAHFEQPLGGIIAAKRSLLRKMRFENDYGVDVGLLLDVAASGANIVEVDIGHIEHDSQTLETLGDMATQVVRTILDRAAKYHRLKLSHIKEVEEIERCSQTELSLVLQKTGKPERLALFDMDGTLLKGRFIVALAQRTNKVAGLEKWLDNVDFSAEARSRGIGKLFDGTPREIFEEVARNMPLMPGATETVVSLRKAGYRVGIVTDSYRVAAEMVRRRVFADFSVSHLMKFRRGKATGDITLSSAMRHPDGCKLHDICKANVTAHLLEHFQLAPEQVLAVGDGENDTCMLRAAGFSVAFHPKSDAVRSAAQVVIEHGPVTELLPFIEETHRLQAIA
jgi:glucosyl-3-phosphoglycerate synthase